MLAASIAGRVFEDLNGNQKWEPNLPNNESALECVQVYVDLNKDGAFGDGEPVKRTGADGGYKFENLDAGDYEIRLVPESGYDRTSPVEFGQASTLVESAPSDHVFDPVRNVLYVANGDRILRQDTKTGSPLSALVVGNSLTAIDITADGKYLLAGEETVQFDILDGFTRKASLYRIDLETSSVTTVRFDVGVTEEGVFDLAVVGNKALITTSSLMPGRVPLRQLDLTTSEVTPRSDLFSGASGQVRHSSRLDRNADGVAVLAEAGDPSGAIYLYDPESDTFPKSVTLNTALDDAHISVSRDGKWIAVETATGGLQILDEDLGVEKTLPHFRSGVSFSPVRDVLYAGDSATDELVAIDTISWNELYRAPAGEDLPDSGVYAEMQTNAKGKYLSYTTPLGVRYIALDRPVPQIVSLSADESVQDVDFGYWWNGSNRRPKGMTDSYSTHEDNTLTVPADSGVSANDRDPDGDTLIVIPDTSTLHGQLLLRPDGSFTYTPNQDYFGSDSFSYRTRDNLLSYCRVTTVTLNVLSVNDGPTDITVGGNSVDENDHGGEIGTVTVVDVDTQDQHSFDVSDPRFEIVNGVLKLRQLVSLNHEEAATIELTITAFDDGIPSQSYSKTFTINVNDVNEFDPTIETNSLEAEEGTVTVGEVTVRDDDTSQTTTIDILAGNDIGIFTIDPDTGRISIADGHELDYETGTTHVLTLRVTDSGIPSRTTTADVTIHVLDKNESAPNVANQTFSVEENSEGGTVVGTVEASDSDTGQTLSFAITGGNDESAFTINSSTGEITVADDALLDYETQNQYQLTVSVTDSGNPSQSSTATIIINLEDENEFGPTIDDQTFHVSESAENGTIVGTVSAVDSDGSGSGTIVYAILSGNDGNIFAIDSATGVVTVADSSQLDYESQAEYELTVSATDDGTPSRATSALVTILVDDVNEVPPVIQDAAFEVEENQTIVGTVTAEDTEAGSTVNYQLSGTDAEWFTINEQGQITVAEGKTLNYEARQQYTVIVVATDNASPPQHALANVEINVLDVNEFEPTIQDQEFEVAENPESGHQIGRILAEDEDHLQTLTFAITGGSGVDIFAVDVSGWISVIDGSAINREAASQYDLLVEVTDSGDPSNSASSTITIHVGDLDEFPASIEDQTFAIPENSPNGTLVGTLVVDDADGTAAFAIVRVTGSNAFTVDNAGRILVTDSSALDFETRPTHQLTVEIRSNGEVTSGGSTVSTDTGVITIHLLDVNEFSPVLEDYEFSIAENSPAGTHVGTVHATDGDTAQTVTYAITSGNDGGTFAIDEDSGEITVANAAGLDFETHSEFLLVVTATDNGNPSRSDSGNVRILVTDGSETPPILNNQSFEIVENSPNGTLVGFVLARDADANESLTYTITGGNSAGAFDLDSVTGELTVANSTAIDFETRPRFRLTVQVADSGSPSMSTSATVTIDVLNVNEAPITILLDKDTVPTHVAGALVGHVSVQDQDVNDRHTFAVDDSRFEINSARELKLVSGVALDSSAGPDIDIHITATDLGGLSRTQLFVLHVIGSSAPWQNPRNRYDVSDDGVIAPFDALLIINEINRPQWSDASGTLQLPRPDIPGLPYYDVNGDGFVTAIDVLMIINRLNNPTAESPLGEGEGESGDGWITHVSSTPSEGLAGQTLDASSVLFASRSHPLETISTRPIHRSTSQRETTPNLLALPLTSRDVGRDEGRSSGQHTENSDLFESALETIAEDIAQVWE